MGSSYFGYPNMGNDPRTDVGGGSSRKGKKGGSDKPKQPQRGLGVAQLEKIRLHGQLGSNNLHPSHHNSYHSSFNQDDIRLQAATYPPFPSSYFTSPSPASYSHNSHFLMGNGYERTSCDVSQPENISSWISGNAMTSAPNLLNFNMEVDSPENNNNSNIVENKELDLELRLSR